MDKAAAMGQTKRCKNSKYKYSKDNLISSVVLRIIWFFISIKATETKTQPRNHANKITPITMNFEHQQEQKINSVSKRKRILFLGCVD